jgi:hypothetical protein
MVESLAGNKVFKPETLKKDFESHHNNVVHISMETEQSIENDLKPAEPVQFEMPEL